MESGFDSIQQLWDESKRRGPAGDDFQHMYKRVRSLQFQNLYYYFGTIVTLSLTAIGLILYFRFLAPVSALTSKIGVLLMLGSLLLRIGIELLSVSRSKKISSLAPASSAIRNSLYFHAFRKQIHAHYEPLLAVAYIIGFLLIGPEFAQYLDGLLLVMIYGSFALVVVILFIVIRKSIRKEMRILEEISSIESEIELHSEN